MTLPCEQMPIVPPTGSDRIPLTAARNRVWASAELSHLGIRKLKSSHDRRQVS